MKFCQARTQILQQFLQRGFKTFIPVIFTSKQSEYLKISSEKIFEEIYNSIISCYYLDINE